jgi:copper chaperone CopZ
VCAHAVRVSMKAVPGVDTVNVSLEKGLASVTLRPGNTATLKQLQEAVAKNGFTMKKSEATIVGTMMDKQGFLELQVSGSSETLHLVPGTNGTSAAATLAGKLVKVTGEIPEAAKGKVPDTFKYNSITEFRP